MAKSILSEQQQNVMDWALNERGHLNLVARAGCGKTYTLLELVRGLVDNANGKRLSIFLGAYNKAIAGEIKAKLESAGITWQQAEAATMHSIGYRAWRKVAPQVEIDDKKMLHIMDQYAEAGESNAQIIADCGGFLNKLVSFAKQRAFGVLCPVEDRSKWFDLVDHFGLEDELEDVVDAPGLDELIDLSILFFKTSRAQDRITIDFDDMILAPLTHKARFWQYDWVLIDEAQDTNPARRALALALLKPGTGRLVAVGDPAQAIYGFTGADSDSMDLIKRQLNSKELPLTMTYRCGKSIVELAQTWVPDIQAHANNPSGEVVTTDVPNFLAVPFNKSDAILCRKNAPLVDLAFRFIRRGIPCRVEGRDIGMGLIAITNKWKLKTIAALLNKLPEYKERELQRYQAKGQEERAAILEDKLDTIVVLCEKLQSEGQHAIEDLRSLILSMFGDTSEAERGQRLTLCSVHKSKGREWDRVFLLGRNRFMPNKWARKDWQLQQEDNLQYTAVTRAKQTLVEVNVREEDNLG